MLISTPPNLSEGNKSPTLVPVMIRGAFLLWRESYNVDKNVPKPESLTAAQLVARSFTEHQEAVQSLIGTKLIDIATTGEVIWAALRNGGKVLLCGNGGSAADAQHIAAELVGRYESNRRSWPAIALTTDTSALTAISNDYGFDAVFERQVEGLAQRGDALIAISTSGKSPNVLRAVAKAKELGCTTIALTGADAEPLASSCDYALVVPAKRTSRIQEVHIVIGHLWCELVDLNGLTASD